MKTNLFFSRNATHYSLIGFISLLVASCGSYQNSSYYDSDGIYGNTPRESQNVSSNHYKEYFSSLQTENIINDTIQNPEQGYPSWGSNPTTTSVNVYADPWSMSIGFGFGYGYGYGYPYYGYGYDYPYYGYGWGYPYYGYGWGYPYYGYGYPHYGYGHNNNYSYNSSRRGSSYANGIYDNNRYPQSSANTNTRGTNYTDFRRSSTNSTTRNSSSFMTRDYSTSQNNSTRTRTNTNTNTNSSRSQNYAPSRTYNSPSSNSNYNSGGRSSGGGSSYGGSSGGGRSTSGSGGRR
jgi:uncharacterized membrane protein YgcG